MQSGRLSDMVSTRIRGQCIIFIAFLFICMLRDGRTLKIEKQDGNCPNTSSKEQSVSDFSLLLHMQATDVTNKIKIEDLAIGKESGILGTQKRTYRIRSNKILQL